MAGEAEKANLPAGEVAVSTFRRMLNAASEVGDSDEVPFNADDLMVLKRLQDDMVKFRLTYKFGIDEVLTKIRILREEFELTHNYSPIEHIGSRLKSVDSLLAKAIRLDCPLEIDAIRDQIRDIAGVRMTCSFVSDAYWLADIITSQPDVTLIESKDYIASPKPNGYRSLHLIVQIPVFLSDQVENVYVEIQIRTIAMDFWASLEHKLYYKYEGEIPQNLLDELKEAADAANWLDAKMARLRDEVDQYKVDPGNGA